MDFAGTFSRTETLSVSDEKEMHEEVEEDGGDDEEEEEEEEDDDDGDDEDEVEGDEFLWASFFTRCCGRLFNRCAPFFLLKLALTGLGGEFVEVRFLLLVVGAVTVVVFGCGFATTSLFPFDAAVASLILASTFGLGEFDSATQNVTPQRVN